MFKRIVKFFADIKAEFKKVSWPSKQQNLRNTYIVIIFIIFMSIFLGILNIIYSQVVQLLF